MTEKRTCDESDGLKGQLDSSAVYQVWLIKGKHPVPAGAFKTDNKGEVTVTYALSEKEASESWDTVAVPLEPKKNNKLPQGPVVLSAAFLIAKGTFRKMKRSTYGGGIHENIYRKRPISVISQTCIDCLLFFSVSVRCKSPLYPATLFDRPHRSFYDS
ncbi:anti-sigma factor [Bacillus safensis]|uniref:anti-sigma factor n=1 Tax=Bacillus safensis TaxID=561879 RepID=UPI00382AA128